MAGTKRVVDRELAAGARDALTQIKDHKVCLRLQAIACCAEQPLQTVASVMGVSRQSVWRWIKRFREHGVEGLMDKPKGHYPAKLDESQRLEIAKWLESAKNSRGRDVHWTLRALAEEVEREFGVSISVPSLWKTIRDMGFRSKSPRPSHAKADPEARERFLKNG